MATILEEDEDTLNSKRKSGPTFVGSGYAGGIDQGGGSPAPVAPDSGPKTQGSGFVNIENYLRGPAQGRMSSALSGETDKVGGEAISAIGNYDKEVAAKTSGGPSFDPNVGGEWLYGVSTNANTPDKPAAFDWGNVTAKQTTYAGPEGFSDTGKLSMYAPMLAATEKAKGRVDLSKKAEGVQTQLQDLYGKTGPYTEGESLLDTQIATTGEGKNLLEQSQNKWGQVDSWLKGSESKAQGKIQGAKDNVTNVNKQWENVGKLAEERAAETNKYFGDSNKRIEEEKAAKIKAANDKAAKDAYNFAKKGPAEYEASLSARQAAEAARRKQYVSDIRSGAVKDGSVWSESDFDNYIKTGVTPSQRNKNKYLAENGGII